MHNIKRTRAVSVIFIISGILFTTIITYIVSHNKGIYDETFYFFLTPNVLLISIGVFLLMKYIRIKNKKISSLLITISMYSYGIYLVHHLVLVFLRKAGINWELFDPILVFHSPQLYVFLFHY
ncbi:MAG: acyltransferase family protein [Bacteroidales bacterium]|nr:acyltransferase family protein [Bacteroidales bacterium]